MATDSLFGSLMNLVEFELYNSSFSRDDREKVEAFKSIFAALDDTPADDLDHSWKPLPAIRERYSEEDLIDAAQCLERGVMAGVEAIESIWFIIGEFLYMLSRGGLWPYLDGQPDSMHAWVILRDEEYKHIHKTDRDNPLMKSYPLLSKYRMIYRKWFFEIGRHNPDVVHEIRQVRNVDVLEAYTRVISPERPKYAREWAKDAQDENDKNRAQRKTKIAARLARKRGVEPYDIRPSAVRKALKDEEKRFPNARIAQRVPKRYRGSIPLDAYVEEEVEAVSERETRVTIRVIDAE